MNVALSRLLSRHRSNRIATAAGNSPPSSHPPPGVEAPAAEATPVVVDAPWSRWEIVAITAAGITIAVTLYRLTQLHPAPAPAPAPIRQCVAQAAGDVMTIHLTRTDSGGLEASCMVSRGRTK